MKYSRNIARKRKPRKHQLVLKREIFEFNLPPRRAGRTPSSTGNHRPPARTPRAGRCRGRTARAAPASSSSTHAHRCTPRLVWSPRRPVEIDPLRARKLVFDARPPLHSSPRVEPPPANRDGGGAAAAAVSVLCCYGSPRCALPSVPRDIPRIKF